MYLVETGPKPEPSPATPVVPPGPKPEPSPASPAVPPGQDYGFAFNLSRLSFWNIFVKM